MAAGGGRSGRSDCVVEKPGKTATALQLEEPDTLGSFLYKTGTRQ